MNDGRAANIWNATLGCFPALVDFRLCLREAQKPSQGLLHLTITKLFCEPDSDFESSELIEATKTVAQIIPIFKRLADLHRNPPSPSFAVPTLQTLHLDGISARLASILAKLDPAGVGLAFSNLQELHVQFVVSKHDWDVDSEDTKAIGKIVAAAPNLMKIDVSVLSQHFRLAFEDIFDEEHGWPLIRHVKFHGVTFSCQDLRGLAERFSNSLRELTISISDERFEEPASWQMCIELLVGSVLPLVDQVWTTTAELKEIFENASVQHHIGTDESELKATWT